MPSVPPTTVDKIVDVVLNILSHGKERLRPCFSWKRAAKKQTLALMGLQKTLLNIAHARGCEPRLLSLMFFSVLNADHSATWPLKDLLLDKNVFLVNEVETDFLKE